jgi:WhiB family transcriptional regulator, redox-sensing transcriptional regulator
MSGSPGYPPGPLLDLIEARAREAAMHPRGFVRDRFGSAGERAYWRWRGGGTVRRDLADRLCIALGVHPTDLWPHWSRTPPGSEAAMPDDVRAWQERSACRHADPDLFFPDSPHDVPPGAQVLCMTCPVFDACFAYGLTQEFGVWANTSEDDRRRIRRNRRIQLPPTGHPLEEPA